MHLSLPYFQGPLPPSSFHDLDYTFSGFLPFKFYPFMCELQPFYFDEQQPKLHHWIKELYRFRASAIDFSVERNQGLPSILFHLGLKQSLKTTDFFVTPKNHSFRKVYFSKEYAYLLSPSWFCNAHFSSKTSRDWFSKNVESHQFSLFLLETLFTKHQRRFWRIRLKGWWNRHLRLENIFSISALHSSASLDADLPYQGDSSSSYHFSFLSNSLDRRSLALSPVKLFHFKYRRFLCSNLYKFSLKVNFRRPLSLSSSLLVSRLVGYINLSLNSSLLLLFSYYLFWKRSLVSPSSFHPSLFYRRPTGLSFTSSLNFIRRTKYYFLPKGLLFSAHLRTYKRARVFLSFYRSLLSFYQPAVFVKALDSLKIERRSPGPLKLPPSLQKWLFVLRRPWYRKRRDKPLALAKLWFLRFLKLRTIHRLRRKLLSLLFSGFRNSGATLFSSSKVKLFLLRKLRFAWKGFTFKRRFFRLRWNLFLKKPLWRRRKLRRLRSFWQWKRALESKNSWQRKPSVVWLDVKFLLRKLFLLFLPLQKASFLLPAVDRFPSFIRFMRKYLHAQHSFRYYLKSPTKRLSLVKKLRTLELYRAKLLFSWVLRWKYFAKRLALYHRLVRLGILRPRLRRRYFFFLSRILRLRRKYWSALSRISGLAYALRRQSFSHSTIVFAKRKRVSFKRILKKSFLPSLLLSRRKFLKRNLSSKRSFWVWARSRSLAHHRRWITRVLRRTKIARAHLRRLRLSRLSLRKKFRHKKKLQLSL